MAINLFNPVYTGFYSALVTAFLLGVVHGITPDEHTWPITFSYAIGTTGRAGGAKAGMIFSAGFTLQRAILSEIAFFALSPVFFLPYYEGIIYIVVGVVMTLSGLYIMKKLRYPHFHTIEMFLSEVFGVHRKDSRDQSLEMHHALNPIYSKDTEMRAVPTRLAFVHGLIAGFGFGAFALILFTVISPSMPNPYVAWLPGFAFGIGTMAMQVAFGSLFGVWIMRVKKLGEKGLRYVSRGISSWVLAYGGMVFAVGGLLTIAYPGIFSIVINTGIKVHNLDQLGIGFFMVIISVVIIGIVAYVVMMRRAEKLYGNEINGRTAHSIK